MKKKFPKYSDYGGKTIDQVFSTEELEHAQNLSVQQTQTCIFYNDTKGNFIMKPLPKIAQISPVFGILITDLNGDGIKDIFLGGNFYGLKPEVGRYDASYGVTLLGKKDGSYQYIPPMKSGLFIKGEVRDARQIKDQKGEYILIARNNDSLQIFTKRNNTP